MNSQALIMQGLFYFDSPAFQEKGPDSVSLVGMVLDFMVRIDAGDADLPEPVITAAFPPCQTLSSPVRCSEIARPSLRDF